jgi:hypothetical protein
MRLQAYRDESRSRLGNNFGHVGGGFCVRRHGPLRIDGRQFEPMGSLKTRTREGHCNKQCPPRREPAPRLS